MRCAFISPHMLLYFRYSCTAHTRYFLCYSPLNRLIPIYYKCKRKNVITFFSQGIELWHSKRFPKSLKSEFGFFSSNCKSGWAFCFYRGAFFKVKDWYKISRDYPFMEMRRTIWCHYLNLIYLQDLKSTILYFNLGFLVPSLSLKGEPESCINSKHIGSYAGYICWLSCLLQSISYQHLAPMLKVIWWKKITIIKTSNSLVSDNQFINILQTSETMLY